MELNKEEQVFLRLLMRDAWYECEKKRKLFLQIQKNYQRS